MGKPGRIRFPEVRILGRKRKKTELRILEEAPPAVPEEERAKQVERALSEIAELVRESVNQDRLRESRPPITKQQAREGVFYWAENRDEHR